MTKPGVNFCGYLRTESGVGAAGRGYIAPLRAVPLAISLHDVSDLQTNRSEHPAPRAADEHSDHPINIVCADIELHYAILQHLGDELFRDRYNIAIWAWELLRFPQRWYDRFAYYDEVWVATSFIAKLLAPVSPVPVIRIPPVLAIDRFGSRERGRKRLGLTTDEFLYLFIFDFNSHFERKNPLAIVEAFQRAFGKSDGARLLLKCVNGRVAPAHLERLRQIADARIKIEEGYWPAEEMRDLMAACDGYVSLHRSEGTGLTISDAMANAKPVIATGWSGNMDFMSAFNSFPVDFGFTAIKENVGPYTAGEIWAEPDVEHAAELMRYVFDHREEANRRGLRARDDIERSYSIDGVAQRIRTRMGAIEVRRRYAEFQAEVAAKFESYRALPEQIRDTVRQHLPADGHNVVLVVSKGDELLLDLPGCEAWHFPRHDNGSYAGYYPADSGAAIRHLEELGRRGARYLLFPSTALWWLDHYREFKAHLDTHHKLVTNNATACVIYELVAQQ